jgi:hypothetical protein
VKRTFGLLGAVVALALSLLAVTSWRAGRGIDASSHREAPLIAYDPQADNTDVYAFISPDRPDFITFILNYIPLEAPYGGPNFFQFGDDVVYALHVDNDGDAVEDITYEWRFTTTVRNPNTFLYNTGPVTSIDDPNLNVRQTYSVTRIDRGQAPRVLIEGVPVAPVNVGVKSFPNYDAVAAQAVREVPGTGGAMVFAGQRDDPFFVDLRIFDLLQPVPPPRDILAGFNVHTIALQAPITRFTRDGQRPTSPDAPNAVIGIWATASRPSTRIFNEDGSTTAGGPMVQVSRLGMPLVNEVVIPRGMKDKFNASHPKDDVANFGQFVLNSHLATLLNIVAMFPAPETDRTDLLEVFATGVKGLNQPPNVVPAEMLRINLAIPPAASPNRMGVLGGDTAGFPNGRRLADDVVDIALQVVGGVLKNVTGTAALTDGVDANDKPFLPSFPYVASPWPGNQ